MSEMSETFGPYPAEVSASFGGIASVVPTGGTTMPTALVQRLLICLGIAAPAVVFRIAGFAPSPVVDLFLFGAAVVAASFMLAWAAEAAQRDISGALAIAILALIAVLPEYAVDLYYAFRSGSDPVYEPYAAANMTGSNRLLLGFGWPLVVIVTLIVANRGLARKSPKKQHFLQIPDAARLDVGCLAVLAVLAFLIPLLSQIPIWLGVVLIAGFVFYLWRASQAENEQEEEFVGTAKLIADMPTAPRRGIVIAMFIGAASIILMAAEPFATALVESGTTLGIDSYFLVQWLAPLASEAPNSSSPCSSPSAGWGRPRSARSSRRRSTSGHFWSAHCP
jgi:cation:H+ antiporter